jgi:histidinol dehydrogenase
MKKSSIISYSKEALRKVKDDVILFAESEGLGAHANAIRVRFEKE